MYRPGRAVARLVCAALLAVLIASISVVSGNRVTVARAAATSETFADYSMMFNRSAGQFFSGDWAGQWAWQPTSSTESIINWGTPAGWPASVTDREHFIRDGDWILIDGWEGNGTYYTQRIWLEQICDADGLNCQTLATSGLQRYVMWNVQSTAYMLKTWGTITEQSSGKVVDFGHTEIWSPSMGCWNQYLGSQTCIKQWESWWDNNGSPGTPITRKQDRDVFLARGLGMAFAVRQYFPSTWNADGRYYWSW